MSTIVPGVRARVARAPVLWAAALLVALGVLALTLRVTLPRPSAVPHGDALWRVEVSIGGEAEAPARVLSISPPWDTPSARVVSQSLRHLGMRQRRRVAPGRMREIELLSTLPGRLAVSAEFVVHVSASERSPPRAKVTLSADRREQLTTPAFALTRERLDEAFGGESLEPALDELFQFVLVAVALDAGGAEQPPDVLHEGQGTALGKTRLFVDANRVLARPARIVTGLVLRDPGPATPHYWAEVLVDGRWLAYDVVRGYAGALPASYLPLRREGESILQGEPGIEARATFELHRETPLPGIGPEAREHWLDAFDLLRLPPAVREMLALLLLLPFGALITALATRLVGVRTYGTFTPSLIAMALVYADWVPTLVLVLVVGAIGIAGRSMLPPKVVKVLRLGIVFTIVALSMALAVSVLDMRDYDAADLVVLLPIVILTGLVDRFYTVADESGLRTALIRLAWTLVVACVCLGLFVHKQVGEMAVAFPEVHFFTLAAIVALMRFRGVTLLDRLGLGWLKEAQRPRPRSGGAR